MSLVLTLCFSAVYDPKRSDNELQSIELFEQFWNDLKDGEKVKTFIKGVGN